MTSAPLDIIKKDSSGRVVIRAALSATLYFERGDDAEKRNRVWECVHQYLDRRGSRLRWVAFDKSQFRSAGSNLAERIRQYLLDAKRAEADDYWALLAHDGLTSEEAGQRRILGLGQPRSDALDKGDLSFVCFAMPLVRSGPPLHEFAEFVHICCERLNPVHGYGGPAFIDAADDGLAAAHANDLYALAQRYRAIDVDYPFDHQLYVKEGIKGGSWLTILSSRYLDELGGLDAIRGQLPATFSFISYSDGALIVAGDTVEIADRNHREEAPLMAALARILRPIRITEHGGVGEAFEAKFDADEYMRWLARFDF